ncbi:hypothetical protein FRC02_007481 [Tulasnella sp. 418]|nr:hypothetical protein FRC02_007481 [Tulasnella sp. 418]
MSVAQVVVPTAPAFSLEANVYGACGGSYAYGLTWTQPITPHGLQQQRDPVSFLDMLVAPEEPATVVLPESNEVVLVVTEGGASSLSSPVQQSSCTKRSASPTEDVEPCKKQKVSSPPSSSSFVTSPMASRYLAARPSIPSPLCPSSQQFSHPPSPTPRRRSRCKEIGLFKLALDPWLRLSRALDTIQPDISPVSRLSSADQKSQVFNPATFPSAGNLRELRKKEPVLQLPFTFDDESNRIRASALRFGDPFGSSPWGVVDA